MRRDDDGSDPSWEAPLSGQVRGRRYARWAATAAGAGLVGIAAAVAGTSAVAGYVSEAGVAGAPLAAVYRLAVLALAGALLLLAVALPRVGPHPGALAAAALWRVGPHPAALAAGALGAAAPLTAVSALVPCSEGCPLPPYARPTAGDIAHASAAITGLALAALGMVILALAAPHPRVRRVSRLAAPVVVPLLAGAALSIVFVGRGVVTGAMERAALGASVGWLIAAAHACAIGEPAEAVSATER